MCRKTDHSAEKGPIHPHAFTFVEVMIALAVASISVLALMRLHLISIRAADTSRIQARAVLLAREKIAEKLALGHPAVCTESGTVHENNLPMHWRTSVTDVQSPPLTAGGIAGLRRILVDVTWRQGLGRKSLQMSTCVADGKIE
ncbi:MAG: prepilin-type N-terminal cleavage/methylation domain-containing protein [Phycisphaerales bacterium]|nr:MAG: prepilin-type N-terminal cleavage/methylation domain-containing protein [Phycisphaerales bacterium]